MGTENDIAQLQAEIDLKTAVVNTMKGLYEAKVAVLETPALALKDEIIATQTKRADDAEANLADAQKQIETLTTQVTALTTPPPESVQVTP